MPTVKDELRSILKKAESGEVSAEDIKTAYSIL